MSCVALRCVALRCNAERVPVLVLVIVIGTGDDACRDGRWNAHRFDSLSLAYRDVSHNKAECLIDSGDDQHSRRQHSHSLPKGEGKCPFPPEPPHPSCRSPPPPAALRALVSVGGARASDLRPPMSGGPSALAPLWMPASFAGAIRCPPQLRSGTVGRWVG